MNIHMYSPNPWFVDLNDPRKVLNEKGDLIAIATHPRDARMIAASPQLFIACKKALGAVKDNPDYIALRKDIQDAVDIVETRLLNVKGI